jgi:hypothetical protein
MLTPHERLRKKQIIRELSRLSRAGWTHTTSTVWQPLEEELGKLDKKEHWGVPPRVTRPARD